jgi:hypothetical protein
MTHSINIQKAETDVNIWFHECDIDDISPYMYVEYVVNTFCEYLEQRGYVCDVSKPRLLHFMCSATCSMYYYEKWKQRKFYIGSPKYKFTRPKQWGGALETQWNDYVHSRIVNYEFWERFWNRLPKAYWESTLTHDCWRDVMQHLLPFYIQRELDILIDEELVCQEENGNIVTWDDHEIEDEPDIRDADGSKKKKSK